MTAGLAARELPGSPAAAAEIAALTDEILRRLDA